MANYFLHLGPENLSDIPVGGSRKAMRRDLTTDRGARQWARRVATYQNATEWRLWRFWNFYDDSTFVEVTRKGE